MYVGHRHWDLSDSPPAPSGSNDRVHSHGNLWDSPPAPSGSNTSKSKAEASFVVGFSNTSRDVRCNCSALSECTTTGATGEISNTSIICGNSPGVILSNTLCNGKLKEVDDKDASICEDATVEVTKETGLNCE